MPTIFTHAVVGVGLASILYPRPASLLYWGLAAGLAMLPDLDVVTFPLGIPYGSRFGHRGFSHSLFCALLVTLPIAWWTADHFGLRWWLLWSILFVIMASHGFLDAFTNGGSGIAFFAPFDSTRYFFPWRPVQVSYIGLSHFNDWFWRVLLSEFIWMWVPTAVLAGVVMFIRILTKNPGPT